MSASRGDRDGRGRLGSAFRRMARWAWERDEVEQTVTRETVVFRLLQYGLLLGVSLAAGGVLWALGRRDTAVTVWVVWVAFTVFFGTISIGWDALTLVSKRRERTRAEQEAPDRREASKPELAPEISVARDTKISFAVTLVVLAMIIAVTLVARALL
mgnify:CR=1 FL=1